jgi:hypothetical protein
MDGHVGKFFESVSSIFRGSDTLPVCDRDIIAVSNPRSPPAPLPRVAPMETCSYSAPVAETPNFRGDVRGFAN